MKSEFEQQLEGFLVNQFKLVNRKLDAIANILKNNNTYVNRNCYKSQIALTPKQLYMCIKGGWTLQELSELSGYGEEDIRKKYNTYIDNNI